MKKCVISLSMIALVALVGISLEASEPVNVSVSVPPANKELSNPQQITKDAAKEAEKAKLTEKLQDDGAKIGKTVADVKAYHIRLEELATLEARRAAAVKEIATASSPELREAAQKNLDIINAQIKAIDDKFTVLERVRRTVSKTSTQVQTWCSENPKTAAAILVASAALATVVVIKNSKTVRNFLGLKSVDEEENETFEVIL